MKTLDLETMSACMASAEEEDDLDTEDQDYPEAVYAVLKENAQEITYQIGEPSVTEETGTVAVEFKYMDLSGAVGAAMGEYLPQAFGMAFSGADEDAMADLFEKILIEKMTSTEPAAAAASVEFSCVMTEDGWRIDEISEEYVNVMTSNIAKGLDDMDEEMGGEADEEELTWHDVPVGQEVELATLRMKVVSCTEETELKSDWSEMNANEGTKFVVFTVDLENISKEPITVDGDDFPFFDSQERTYSASSDASVLMENALSYRELAPNMPETGVIVYNVPADCEGYGFTARKAGTSDAYRFLGK